MTDLEAEMNELRALAESLPAWALAQAWEALAVRLAAQLIVDRGRTCTGGIAPEPVTGP